MQEKDKHVKSDEENLEISEEVNIYLKKSGRRIRYYEYDIKLEQFIVSKDNAIFIPGKEDSYDRLTGLGKEFSDDNAGFENSVIRKLMIEKMIKCLDHLDSAERELIYYLFFANHGKGISERELSAKSGIPQKTINNRKKRIMLKLKKLIEK